MNPLTLVKRIQKINSKEAALGISDEASWHVKYKESAYVFVGGIPFDLTEGDLLAVFAQYGEIVDVNLVRDKGTGKSKGFAFIAYEDQRSTNLAVDNLNGALVLGRIIRVDHVSNYKKKEEEDEEAEQQKREARGVCRAFQRGECNRGAGCKFSHDEQRAANSGWGARDKSSSWGHDKFDGLTQNEKRSKTLNHISDLRDKGMGSGDKVAKNSRAKGQGVFKTIDRDNKDLEGWAKSKKERNHREDRDGRGTEKMPTRHDTEPISRDDYDRRGERRSKRRNSESSPRGDQDERGTDRRSAHDRHSSSHRHGERDGDRRR